MSNLVKVGYNPITKIAINRLNAAAVVGFTGYLTGCILLDSTDKDSKRELLTELYSAAFITWKWYMGLGPEPVVNTGVPNEVSRCKKLERG